MLRPQLADAREISRRRANSSARTAAATDSGVAGATTATATALLTNSSGSGNPTQNDVFALSGSTVCLDAGATRASPLVALPTVALIAGLPALLVSATSFAALCSSSSGGDGGVSAGATHSGGHSHGAHNLDSRSNNATSSAGRITSAHSCGGGGGAVASTHPQSQSQSQPQPQQVRSSRGALVLRRVALDRFFSPAVANRIAARESREAARHEQRLQARLECSNGDNDDDDSTSVVTRLAAGKPSSATAMTLDAPVARVELAEQLRMARAVLSSRGSETQACLFDILTDHIARPSSPTAQHQQQELTVPEKLLYVILRTSAVAAAAAEAEETAAAAAAVSSMERNSISHDDGGGDSRHFDRLQARSGNWDVDPYSLEGPALFARLVDPPMAGNGAYGGDDNANKNSNTNGRQSDVDHDDDEDGDGDPFINDEHNTSSESLAQQKHKIELYNSNGGVLGSYSRPVSKKAKAATMNAGQQRQYPHRHGHHHRNRQQRTTKASSNSSITALPAVNRTLPPLEPRCWLSATTIALIEQSAAMRDSLQWSCSPDPIVMATLDSASAAAAAADDDRVGYINSCNMNSGGGPAMRVRAACGRLLSASGRPFPARGNSNDVAAAAAAADAHFSERGGQSLSPAGTAAAFPSIRNSNNMDDEHGINNVNYCGGGDGGGSGAMPSRVASLEPQWVWHSCEGTDAAALFQYAHSGGVEEGDKVEEGGHDTAAAPASPSNHHHHHQERRREVVSSEPQPLTLFIAQYPSTLPMCSIVYVALHRCMIGLQDPFLFIVEHKTTGSTGEIQEAYLSISDEFIVASDDDDEDNNANSDDSDVDGNEEERGSDTVVAGSGKAKRRLSQAVSHARKKKQRTDATRNRSSSSAHDQYNKDSSSTTAPSPRRCSSGLAAMLHWGCESGTLFLRLSRLCELANEREHRPGLGSYGQAATEGLRLALAITRRIVVELAERPGGGSGVHGVSFAELIDAQQRLRAIAERIAALAAIFGVTSERSWRASRVIPQLSSATLLSALYARFAAKSTNALGGGETIGSADALSSASSSPSSSSSSSSDDGDDSEANSNSNNDGALVDYRPERNWDPSDPRAAARARRRLGRRMDRLSRAFDPAAFILLRALRPLHAMLHTWLTHGELADPLDEFFIVPTYGATTTSGYTVDCAPHRLPVFISADAAGELLHAGVSLRVLRAAATHIILSAQQELLLLGGRDSNNAGNDAAAAEDNMAEREDAHLMAALMKSFLSALVGEDEPFAYAHPLPAVNPLSEGLLATAGGGGASFTSSSAAVGGGHHRSHRRHSAGSGRSGKERGVVQPRDDRERGMLDYWREYYAACNSVLLAAVESLIEEDERVEEQHGHGHGDVNTPSSDALTGGSSSTPAHRDPTVAVAAAASSSSTPQEDARDTSVGSAASHITIAMLSDESSDDTTGGGAGRRSSVAATERIAAFAADRARGLTNLAGGGAVASSRGTSVLGLHSVAARNVIHMRAASIFSGGSNASTGVSTTGASSRVTTALYGAITEEIRQVVRVVQREASATEEARRSMRDDYDRRVTTQRREARLVEWRTARAVMRLSRNQAVRDTIDDVTALHEAAAAAAVVAAAAAGEKMMKKGDGAHANRNEEDRESHQQQQQVDETQHLVSDVNPLLGRLVVPLRSTGGRRALPRAHPPVLLYTRGDDENSDDDDDENEEQEEDSRGRGGSSDTSHHGDGSYSGDTKRGRGHHRRNRKPSSSTTVGFSVAFREPASASPSSGTATSLLTGGGGGGGVESRMATGRAGFATSSTTAAAAPAVPPPPALSIMSLPVQSQRRYMAPSSTAAFSALGGHSALPGAPSAGGGGGSPSAFALRGGIAGSTMAGASASVVVVPFSGITGGYGTSRRPSALAMRGLVHPVAVPRFPTGAPQPAATTAIENEEEVEWRQDRGSRAVTQQRRPPILTRAATAAAVTAGPASALTTTAAAAATSAALGQVPRTRPPPVPVPPHRPAVRLGELTAEALASMATAATSAKHHHQGGGNEEAPAHAQSPPSIDDDANKNAEGCSPPLHDAFGFAHPGDIYIIADINDDEFLARRVGPRRYNREDFDALLAQLAEQQERLRETAVAAPGYLEHCTEVARRRLHQAKRAAKTEMNASEESQHPPEATATATATATMSGGKDVDSLGVANGIVGGGRRSGGGAAMVRQHFHSNEEQHHHHQQQQEKDHEEEEEEDPLDACFDDHWIGDDLRANPPRVWDDENFQHCGSIFSDPTASANTNHGSKHINNSSSTRSALETFDGKRVLVASRRYSSGRRERRAQLSLLAHELRLHSDRQVGAMLWCPRYYLTLGRTTASYLTHKALQLTLLPPYGSLYRLLRQILDVCLLQSGPVASRLVEVWCAGVIDPALEDDDRRKRNVRGGGGGRGRRGCGLFLPSSSSSSDGGAGAGGHPTTLAEMASVAFPEAHDRSDEESNNKSEEKREEEVDSPEERWRREQRSRRLRREPFRSGHALQLLNAAFKREWAQCVLGGDGTMAVDWRLLLDVHQQQQQQRHSRGRGGARRSSVSAAAAGGGGGSDDVYQHMFSEAAWLGKKDANARRKFMRKYCNPNDDNNEHNGAVRAGPAAANNDANRLASGDWLTAPPSPLFLLAELTLTHHQPQHNTTTTASPKSAADGGTFFWLLPTNVMHDYSHLFCTLLFWKTAERLSNHHWREGLQCGEPDAFFFGSTTRFLISALQQHVWTGITALSSDYRRSLQFGSGVLFSYRCLEAFTEDHQRFVVECNFAAMLSPAFARCRALVYQLVRLVDDMDGVLRRVNADMAAAERRAMAAFHALVDDSDDDESEGGRGGTHQTAAATTKPAFTLQRSLDAHTPRASRNLSATASRGGSVNTSVDDEEGREGRGGESAAGSEHGASADMDAVYAECLQAAPLSSSSSAGTRSVASSSSSSAKKAKLGKRKTGKGKKSNTKTTKKTAKEVTGSRPSPVLAAAAAGARTPRGTSPALPGHTATAATPTTTPRQRKRSLTPSVSGKQKPTIRAPSPQERDKAINEKVKRREQKKTSAALTPPHASSLSRKRTSATAATGTTSAAPTRAELARRRRHRERTARRRAGFLAIARRTIAAAHAEERRHVRDAVKARLRPLALTARRLLREFTAIRDACAAGMDRDGDTDDDDREAAAEMERAAAARGGGDADPEDGDDGGEGLATAQGYWDGDLVFRRRASTDSTTGNNGAHGRGSNRVAPEFVTITSDVQYAESTEQRQRREWLAYRRRVLQARAETMGSLVRTVEEALASLQRKI